MLAHIDKYEGGVMVDSLKLILFDAEKRLFIVQGLLPLDAHGRPLAEDKYCDFYNFWVPKVAAEWQAAVRDNRTQTNKVSFIVENSSLTLFKPFLLNRSVLQAFGPTRWHSPACSPSQTWSKPTTTTRATRT